MMGPRSPGERGGARAARVSHRRPAGRPGASAPRGEASRLRAELQQAAGTIRTLRATVATQTAEISRLKASIESTREMSALLASQGARRAVEARGTPRRADAGFAGRDQSRMPRHHGEHLERGTHAAESATWAPLPELFSEEERRRLDAALDTAQGKESPDTGARGESDGPGAGDGPDPGQKDLISAEDGAAAPASPGDSASAASAPSVGLEDQVLRLQSMVSMLVDQRAVLHTQLGEAQRQCATADAATRREAELREGAERALAEREQYIHALKSRCAEMEDRASEASTQLETERAARREAEAAAAQAQAAAYQAQVEVRQCHERNRARAQTAGRARAARKPLRSALQSAQATTLRAVVDRWRSAMLQPAWTAWSGAAGVEGGGAASHGRGGAAAVPAGEQRRGGAATPARVPPGLRSGGREGGPPSAHRASRRGRGHSDRASPPSPTARAGRAAAAGSTNGTPQPANGGKPPSPLSLAQLAAGEVEDFLGQVEGRWRPR